MKTLGKSLANKIATIIILAVLFGGVSGILKVKLEVEPLPQSIVL